VGRAPASLLSNPIGILGDYPQVKRAASVARVGLAASRVRPICAEGKKKGPKDPEGRKSVNGDSTPLAAIGREAVGVEVVGRWWSIAWG